MPLTLSLLPGSFGNHLVNHYSLRSCFLDETPQKFSAGVTDDNFRTSESFEPSFLEGVPNLAPPSSVLSAGLQMPGTLLGWKALGIFFGLAAFG